MNTVPRFTLTNGKISMYVVAKQQPEVAMKSENAGIAQTRREVLLSKGIERNINWVVMYNNTSPDMPQSCPPGETHVTVPFTANFRFVTCEPPPENFAQVMHAEANSNSDSATLPPCSYRLLAKSIPCGRTKNDD